MKWAAEKNGLTLERHWGLPGSIKCASVLESLETRPSSQMRVHGTRGAAVFGRVGWGSRGGMYCLAALPSRPPTLVWPHWLSSGEDVITHLFTCAATTFPWMSA